MAKVLFLKAAINIKNENYDYSCLTTLCVGQTKAIRSLANEQKGVGCMQIKAELSI
jgi:hypothetical protein